MTRTTNTFYGNNLNFYGNNLNCLGDTLVDLKLQLEFYHRDGVGGALLGPRLVGDAFNSLSSVITTKYPPYAPLFFIKFGHEAS